MRLIHRWRNGCKCLQPCLSVTYAVCDKFRMLLYAIVRVTCTGKVHVTFTVVYVNYLRARIRALILGLVLGFEPAPPRLRFSSVGV